MSFLRRAESRKMQWTNLDANRSQSRESPFLKVDHGPLIGRGLSLPRRRILLERICTRVFGAFVAEKTWRWVRR